MYWLGKYREASQNGIRVTITEGAFQLLSGTFKLFKALITDQQNSFVKISQGGRYCEGE